MAKRGKKESNEPLPVGSLERFVSKKVHRRHLTNAPYNPRSISDAERDRLREIVETHGLVGPITWNERTGNIVGGHQRVSMCDALYQTDDYEMTVAAIDVDLVREKEINLALNNLAAQGNTDLDKLEAMFKDTPEMRIEATGFSGHELFQLFGSSPFEQRADDALSEVAQKIREARTRQEETRSKVKSREEVHFYLVIIFRDDKDRTEFTESVGWADNRYQSGAELRLMCAEWIAKRAAEAAAAEEEEEEEEEEEGTESTQGGERMSETGQE
jgi:hypothetical protein